MQQAILMAVLATMVYTVSLDLRPDDFRYVARHPLAVGIGLLAQFVLLPGATLLLTLMLDLPPATEAAIEGGMQNSGLALGIIAAQFGSDLAMVAVAGLWGVWHIVSGGTLAVIWRRRDRVSRLANLPAAETR